MNHLYYGDNLEILRSSIKDESVDLIYLDPPFNSQTNYNILFKGPQGHQSSAQVEAFVDSWHWNEQAERAYDEVLAGQNTDISEMLRAMRVFLQDNDMMAYLTMMAVRLIELHRVLKATGTLYLHCDPTASHYLKILLDAVFGKKHFLNEIIWKRTASHSSARRWGPVHDVIFAYAKTEDYIWNDTFMDYDEAYLKTSYRLKDERGPYKSDDLTGAGITRRYSSDNLTGAGAAKGDSGLPWRGIDPSLKKRHWAIPMSAIKRYGLDEGFDGLTTQEKLDRMDTLGLIDWPKTGAMPRFKRYLERDRGVHIQDVITDLGAISAQAKERLGYPTQKPLALLERILAASSNQDALVLDPFCGCGTTIHAAQKMGRRWIGIDITHLAISLIEKRITDAFKDIAFTIHGTPKDLEGARALAKRDKYQFQWWAISLVNAVPFGGKKKGADGGIDGLLYFKPDGKKAEQAIISVKGGETVSVAMVRDLVGVMEREKAKIALLITLTSPTSPMLTEAAKTGLYDSPHHGKIARLQILTIEELLGGKTPHIPFLDFSTSKKARREDRSEQNRFL